MYLAIVQTVLYTFSLLVIAFLSYRAGKGQAKLMAIEVYQKFIDRVKRDKEICPHVRTALLIIITEMVQEDSIKYALENGPKKKIPTETK